MPLPTDTTLGLMGFSKPGETSQSRPKQAMLIRMSDKTLDLLESSPQLHFDFSESPVRFRVYRSLTFSLALRV